MDHIGQTARIGELVARARSDAAFLARLMEDTSGTLRNEGIDFPAWLRLRGIEDGEPVFQFALPVVSGELSDADLESVAGGEDKVVADHNSKRSKKYGLC